LDVAYSNGHIGSLALRLFIEKYQPYLTFHGHVHETVKRSGEYKHQIGRTLCLTAGNDGFGFQIAVLALDLCDHLKVTRSII
jgi:Icc-related predicted phosphoesterase